MGRAQSDTYSSLFTKSDNVNLDKNFDRKSMFVHVLTYMVQNKVDRVSISIHSKFDIPLINHLVEYYHLSLRGGLIFSNIVFASCMVSFHNHLPIYCCTIHSVASHLLPIVYA